MPEWHLNQQKLEIIPVNCTLDLFFYFLDEVFLLIWGWGVRLWGEIKSIEVLVLIKLI